MRLLVVVFGATAYPTAPFDVPELPLVMLIQLAFDAAVHEQPAPAVTVAVALPPAAGSDSEAGETA